MVTPAGPASTGKSAPAASTAKANPGSTASGSRSDGATHDSATHDPACGAGTAGDGSLVDGSLVDVLTVDSSTVDVLIVGAGPVGLVCALLLAGRGWRVTVVERWPAPYPQPRAVHFDDEVARLLADAGIGEQIPAITEPADIYEWRNGRAETLLRFDWSGDGPSGWPLASMTHQPGLEDALTEAADAVPGLVILRGHEAVGLHEIADGVQIDTQDGGGVQHHLQASW